MHFTIKTKAVSDTQAVDTGTEFRSLDKALAKVFELIDYIEGEVSEILICSEDKPMYSIKPLGNKQFIVQEMF